MCPSYSGEITYQKTRKNDKGKIIDKPSYCFYCQKKISSRLVRHLRDAHSSEIAVARMLLIKDPAEQKRAAQVIKNLGNNQHNAEVLWKNEGEMIVARASSDELHWDPNKYAPCDLCFGWYREDELYRHQCPGKTKGAKPSLKAGRAIRDMMSRNMSRGDGYSSCWDGGR